jgi:hypothetical protein
MVKIITRLYMQDLKLSVIITQPKNYFYIFSCTQKRPAAKEIENIAMDADHFVKINADTVLILYCHMVTHIRPLSTLLSSS